MDIIGKFEYETTRRFSDSIINNVKRILSKHFNVSIAEIAETNEVIDMTENADLILMDIFTISVRTRKIAYFKKYGNEFTIRTTPGVGGKTEWSKVKDGFGDYNFYGFVGKNNKIVKYYIIDLHKIRAAIIDNYKKCQECHRPKRHFYSRKTSKYIQSFFSFPLICASQYDSIIYNN